MLWCGVWYGVVWYGVVWCLGSTPLLSAEDVLPWPFLCGCVWVFCFSFS